MAPAHVWRATKTTIHSPSAPVVSFPVGGSSLLSCAARGPASVGSGIRAGGAEQLGSQSRGRRGLRMVSVLPEAEASKAGGSGHAWISPECSRGPVTHRVAIHQAGWPSVRGGVASMACGLRPPEERLSWALPERSLPASRGELPFSHRRRSAPSRRAANGLGAGREGRGPSSLGRKLAAGSLRSTLRIPAPQMWEAGTPRLSQTRRKRRWVRPSTRVPGLRSARR